jgi:membrane protease YdiL (CAAX protease family)
MNLHMVHLHGYAGYVAKSLGLAKPIPLVLTLLLVATIGLPLDLVAARGEEIGWAGYVTPRLLEGTDLSKASLVVGLIWAVWH